MDMIASDLSLFDHVDNWDARRIFAHYRGALKTISYQMEDVVLERGIHTRMFAGFQKFSFFLPRAKRYRELARVADGVYVFGIPDTNLPPIPGVHYIPLTRDHALVDEWFLVVDSPEYFSALVAHDLTGLDVPAAKRRFRGVWTFDDDAVGELQRLLSQAVGLEPLDTGRDLPRNYRRQLSQLAYAAGNLVNTLESRNRELHQAQKLRDDLFNMLIHDMRNPLATIVGNLSLIEGYADRMPDDELRYFVGTATSSARDLNHMVDDLLDIARLEDDELRLQFAVSSPVELLANAVSQAQAQLRNSDKVVRLDDAGDLPQVLAEVEKIERVLTNLVDNAIKYTPREGVITLSAARSEGMVRFAVADNGTGIPPESQERIFEKFGQAGGKDQRRGTGLGLAFCKMMVEAHGGRIWVESVVGEGSTFYFTLPLA